MKCKEFVDAKQILITNPCSLFKHSKPYYTLEFLPGKYLFELYGASGGFTKYGKVNDPGKGGYTKGVLKLPLRTKLYLYVGSQGGNTTSEPKHSEGGEPGYNGGAAGAYDTGIQSNCPSAGGGGATDIRINEGDWNLEESLKSRIMVAGGGGSAGCYTLACRGGNGGGINGEDGSPNECGIEGGKGGGKINGTFGEGLEGEPGTIEQSGEAGGSGGGGYYGGGSGGTSYSVTGSGGGGSSFVSGYFECVCRNHSLYNESIHYSNIAFRSIIMENGLSTFKSPDGIEEEGHLGDGFVRITVLQLFSKQQNNPYRL